jgi:uncharacterized membrane protein YgdD (TMEM256/DUF423 family)
MAIAVSFGAIGSHILHEKLTERYMNAFESGVRYQVYHSLALILFGILNISTPLPKYIYYLFLAGIVLFSGSLYGLSLGSIEPVNKLAWLGPVTPLGGLSFILAWVLFGWTIFKR